MAIEVFSRAEYKYVLCKEQYDFITNALKTRMVSDSHNKNNSSYTISNLYYDTKDNDLILTSLEKPVYKEKLRLRSYGVPHRGDKVFLEIKKKYKGIVYKRRTALLLQEAYEFIETKQVEPAEYMNSQVINELKYFLETNTVKPKVYIAYDRIAYFGKDDPDLRISFDMNIRTRRDNLFLEAGDFGKPLLPPDIYIMEIKGLYAMPLWLTHLLSEMDIRRTSFSKYGTEFRQSFKEGLSLSDATKSVAALKGDILNV